ncbi:MAG: MFS transporter [Pseudomonadota bacterium]
MKPVVVLLSLAGFGVVALLRLTDPLVPMVSAAFDTTVGRASIIVTSFAVPYGLFQLFFGPLGERIGKLLVIALTLTASGVLTMACALANDLPALALLRFLAGAASAAAVPLSLAYIGDNEPYESRQPVIGFYLQGLIFGQVLGGLLGGIVADTLGWRGLFLVFGGVNTALGVYLLTHVRAYGDRTSPVPLGLFSTLKAYWSLLIEKHASGVYVAVAVEGFCVFGVLAFIGAFLRNTQAMNYTTIGLMMAGFGAGGLIYVRIVRWLVEYVGERGMILSGGSIIFTAYVLLPMLERWPLIAIDLFVAGFGFYMMHNTLQTIVTELSPQARGLGVAVFVMMLFAGQGLGVLILGAIIDRGGYQAMFLTAAAIQAALVIRFRGLPFGNK